jgi:hypothetical protein
VVDGPLVVGLIVVGGGVVKGPLVVGLLVVVGPLVVVDVGPVVVVGPLVVVVVGPLQEFSHSNNESNGPSVLHPPVIG